MWPFAKKPLLDAETADWHVENFRWLIGEFGERTAFFQRELILPTPDSFQTGGLKGHELAVHVFEQVKEKAGLAGWPATVAAHDNDFGDYEGTNLIRPVFESRAAGTFSVDETKTVIITYSAKLLKDPHGLVATFAHELSHYLLFSSKSKWPVPQEEMEFLTDLTAVFLGFGIFLCNTRFRYQQFSDGISAGWSWNRQGYLPESDLLFASACFLKARQLGSGDAEKYLKPGLIKDFRRAIDQAAEAAFQHRRPEP